ncbi:hypothetical protein HWV62_1641 [Athelia sp. TMB]|nr:hypothetical protein HWV62_1641 [Athelia sp. TMB]
MVQSLSKESSTEMVKLGRTLLASYAYDNVDIDLKHATPTGDALEDTLVHLTSGTMIRLDHGVTPNMLACSEFLWRKCKHNPDALPEDIPRGTSYLDLLDIYPEDEHVSGLTRRQRFGAWAFLRDLIAHGPPYFQQFRRRLAYPETMDAIPVKRSRQVPCRMMNINPSTTINNVSVLEDLFRQGGVGDTSETNQLGAVNVGDHVILVHGDLLTGERIQSLQESRSEESTPWRCFQFVVYVMGLFHLKMACADAVWRMFIQPSKAKGMQGVKRESINSLMSHVSIIRPKETLKIETKPGFRRVHEIIEHVGIVSRLDCWRLEATRRAGRVLTLEDFARSEPQWEDLEAMANQLVQEQVASFETFSNLRTSPTGIRDCERENLLL